jgi:hypothetical protein
VPTTFWWGNLREREHLEDPSVDGRILKRIDWKMDVEGDGLDWFGAEYGEMAGSCECGNELSGSIKCGNFLSG